MEINVQAINEITIKYEMSAPATFIINVYLRNHQIEDLFYLIWEEFGTEGINEFLNREGRNYKFVKIK